MLRQGIFDHHRLDDLIAGVAAGAPSLSQAVYGPAPEGYCWYVERISFAVIGNSHTAGIDAAVTPDNGPLPVLATWDHSGLVWKYDGGSALAAVAGSQGFDPAVYVPSGHWLHLFGSGGTLANGDVISYTLQTAVHQLDPAYLMTPEDRAQVAAAHEHAAQHAVADVATAGRRAV